MLTPDTHSAGLLHVQHVEAVLFYVSPRTKALDGIAARITASVPALALTHLWPSRPPPLPLPLPHLLAQGTDGALQVVVPGLLASGGAAAVQPPVPIDRRSQDKAFRWAGGWWLGPRLWR